MTKRTKGTTTIRALELPTATVKQLDHYAARLTEILGIPATRADAAFLALDKGLVQVAKDFDALDNARLESKRSKRTKGKERVR